MKTRQIFACAVALFFAAALTACAGHSENAAHSEHSHPAHVELSAGAFMADSIFHLETEWVNPEGEKQTLAEALGGKPAAAAMIYTSCEHACPVIVADMLKIRQALGGDAEGTRFVLFSFDPERDTPSRMRDYRGAQKLSRWTILSPAGPGGERELAAALGVRFKPIAGGDFAHSNIIFILDANGVPRHRQIGLLLPPDESVAVLRGLLEK